MDKNDSKLFRKLVSISKRIDYPVWFSNVLARDYLGMFPSRLKAARTAKQKKKIRVEENIIEMLYAFFIFYFYPRNGKFRRAIDSNAELKANFASLKKALGRSKALEDAEYFMKLLAADAGRAFR